MGNCRDQYKVEDGETCSSLSNKFAMSLALLQTRLECSQNISGELLCIDSGYYKTAFEAANQNTRTGTVADLETGNQETTLPIPEIPEIMTASRSISNATTTINEISSATSTPTPGRSRENSFENNQSTAIYISIGIAAFIALTVLVSLFTRRRRQPFEVKPPVIVLMEPTQSPPQIDLPLLRQFSQLTDEETSNVPWALQN